MHEVENGVWSAGLVDDDTLPCLQVCTRPQWYCRDGLRLQNQKLANIFLLVESPSFSPQEITDLLMPE